METKGRLIGASTPFEEIQPGDYWKDPRDGSWRAVTPNGHHCWLKNHHVEEHEGGEISVVSGPWGSNSILVHDGRHRNLWHGFIVKGVWKEC